MLQTIVGKRGYGKTTKAKNLIRESQHKNVFVLDYILEYQEISSDRVHVFREGIDTFYYRIRDASSKDPSNSMLVVLDEVDLYGKFNTKVDFLYRYGRHYHIDVIAVSRRFYDLPMIIRALTDQYCLFRISEPRDLDYMSKRIPGQILKVVANLDRFEYINVSI